MEYIVLGVEENKLIRNIVIRICCVNHAAYRVGLLLAVHAIEEAEKIEIRPVYVENVQKAIAHKTMPFVISFSIFYKDEEMREKFLNIIKKHGSCLES